MVERGIEVQPVTILLNIAVPAALGILTGILMEILERIFRKKAK